MKDFYFYSIMRNTITQFLDMFNDIRIARYDHATGEILKYVSVPLKFAPKTKQFYWVDKRDENGGLIRDKILPMIAVNLTGMAYSSERAVNKVRRITKGRNEEFSTEKYRNPVPYDYTFDVKIATQYMVDVTQIVEQILAYFSPTSNIRITVPELGIGHENVDSGYPLDLKVIYEGVTPDMPVDIGEDAYRAIEWTMNFKVEGYLFQPIKEEKIVKKVVNKIYGSDTAWEHRLDTTTETVSGGGYNLEEVLVTATHTKKYDDDMRILHKYEVFEPEEQ